MIDKLKPFDETLQTAKTDFKEEAAKIETLRAEAQEKRRNVNKALDAAVTDADAEAYGKAKAELATLTNEIELYSKRLEQLYSHSFIDEKTSDSFVDSVLEAERKLTAEYIAATKLFVEDLKSLTTQYRRNIADADSIITSWCNDIHPNYRTFGQTTRLDPTTGQYTDRALQPVRVPSVKCDEAFVIENFVKRFEG